ncbi:hypothetical protein [Muricoccus radiodurans]|uniref:hypothetical protein n=1 Tax=Muricoccus radiodurans TaxID=2231721 RepID=UPI003CF4EE89
MTALRATLGYAGLIGFLVSGLMILWHAWRIARHGGGGLLVNDFRFFDRKRHPPAVQPHVSATWHWAGVAAISFVLFAVGATVM